MNIADIEADLVAYADYRRLGSVERAQLFSERADQWLILRAESASNQSSSMSMGKQHVADMKRAADAFVAKNSTSGQVSFLGPGGFFR
jgi:hypothetical protein